MGNWLGDSNLFLNCCTHMYPVGALNSWHNAVSLPIPCYTEHMIKGNEGPCDQNAIHLLAR